MNLTKLFDVLKEIDAVERCRIDWRGTGKMEAWTDRADVEPTAEEVKLFASAELDLTMIENSRSTAIWCYRRVARRLADRSRRMAIHF